MNLKITTEIPLIKPEDETLKAENIIPYQKCRMDHRETAYQYDFLNKEDKRVIDDMLLVCQALHDAFINIEHDLEDLRDEEQSIYDLVCEQLQFSIGEYVTGFIEDMDAEELKKNILDKKGEAWYREYIGEL